MISLSTNTYGKSRVRLVKVRRSGNATDLREWSCNILLDGDFNQAYTAGDNSLVLPTDTMKNTVYSLARDSDASSPEQFGQVLVRHFLATNDHVSRVRTEIAEKSWEHLMVDRLADPTTFRLTSSELKTAAISGDRTSMTVRSGFDNLAVMKTSNSAFAGFKRDRLTTLPETSDRLLGTAMRAEWGYRSSVTDFEQIRSAVRNQLLASFASHRSQSVQHTLFAMAEAALEANPEITDIELAMPNLHCLLVDLKPFGQDNPNEIFVPIDEPHGFIQAKVQRS